MSSEFVAALRHRTHHSRMDPSRARSRDFKAGPAARLEVPQLYPDIRLEETQGCTDAAGTSLWLKSLLWASECYNRAAISVNDKWLSPHEMFYGSRPRLLLLPFLQPAYHRVPRQQKTDPRARMCYFLNFGYNHGRDCYRLLGVETERVAYSRDVTWHHPEIPWITLSPCRSLCPSPRHLLHPSPLRQLPHRQRHYRHHLYQRRTPRLRSPRALAAN